MPHAMIPEYHRSASHSTNKSHDSRSKMNAKRERAGRFELKFRKKIYIYTFKKNLYKLLASLFNVKFRIIFLVWKFETTRT